MACFPSSILRLPSVVEIVVSARPLLSDNSFCAFRFNAFNRAKAASIDAGLGCPTRLIPIGLPDSKIGPKSWRFV